MWVWFKFTQDTRTEKGERFIRARIFVRQSPTKRAPDWGMVDTEIAVWIPFPAGASMNHLRKAALRSARHHARIFAAAPRRKIELIETTID